MMVLRYTLAVLALGIIAAMIGILPARHGCETVGHVVVLGCR
jgi:hypothetical protein